MTDRVIGWAPVARARGETLTADAGDRFGLVTSMDAAISLALDVMRDAPLCDVGIALVSGGSVYDVRWLRWGAGEPGWYRTGDHAIDRGGRGPVWYGAAPPAASCVVSGRGAVAGPYRLGNGTLTCELRGPMAYREHAATCTDPGCHASNAALLRCARELGFTEQVAGDWVALSQRNRSALAWCDAALSTREVAA